MAVQLSTALRNAMADAIYTALGANFTVEIRTGAPPANCAAADTGTLLVTFTGVDYGTASGGAISLTGTPYTATAGNTGSAGHYRMKNGSTCIQQGTVATSGGDMDIAPSLTITSGLGVDLTAHTITIPNS